MLFAQGGYAIRTGGGSVPNAVMPRRLPPSQLGLARRFYFARLVKFASISISTNAQTNA
jgi:hypothetical protein